MFWQSKSSKKMIEAFEDWCVNAEPASDLVSISAQVIQGKASGQKLSDLQLIQGYRERIEVVRGDGTVASVSMEHFASEGVDVQFPRFDQDPWADGEATYLWNIFVSSQIQLRIANERVHSLNFAVKKKVTE